ncbi:hypothetical protein [Corallococcus macrosporus]|uniref:Uncharacterized protein n=1 Tax=Myxococcus fulvus (strain ATCC BAA-855 / HW-1) TaxID=483219 RepID=F8CA98_MYXFH|nr:hypothetical protein [Corallococcus macrosporus]AEI64555.1 hypothetical protein LILAB_13240 [Corallococcus macrosporus]
MEKGTPESSEAPACVWREVETYARRKVQDFVHAVLEEEVTEMRTRVKSQGRAAHRAGGLPAV